MSGGNCKLGSIDCCVLQEVWHEDPSCGEDETSLPLRSYVHRTEVVSGEKETRCFSPPSQIVKDSFFTGHIDAFSGVFSLKYECNEKCSSCASSIERIDRVDKAECQDWNDFFPGEHRSADQMFVRFRTVSCSAFTCTLGEPGCCLLEEDYVGAECEGLVGFKHFFTPDELNEDCSTVPIAGGGSAYFSTSVERNKRVVAVGLDCDKKCKCKTPVEVVGEGICFQWSSLNPRARNFPHKSARWTPFPCIGISKDTVNTTPTNELSSSSGADSIVVALIAVAGCILIAFAYLRHSRSEGRSVVSFEPIPSHEMGVL